MFGERLKDILEEKDITQTQLAKALGFSAQAINRWCNNITEPDINTIIKLSHYLEISTDYLLGGNGINKNEEDIKEKLVFKNLLIKAGYLKENEKISNEDIDTILEFIKTNKKYIDTK